jgi:hypothetical protein
MIDTSGDQIISEPDRIRTPASPFHTMDQNVRILRHWCLMSEAAMQGEKFLKPMSLTYPIQCYRVALLVDPGNSYHVIVVMVAVKLYGSALWFKSLLMHMGNDDQSMNTSQFMNATWEIHCLVLQGILSEYYDDAVLQLYQLDEHECVSLSCSNSGVLRHHLPRNSRRFHLVVIANVNKALGLQVTSGNSTSSLELFEVAGQIRATLSNEVVSNGNVVPHGLLSQFVAEELVQIGCWTTQVIEMNSYAAIFVDNCQFFTLWNRFNITCKQKDFIKLMGMHYMMVYSKGAENDAVFDPVKTNKFPRQNPQQAWYLQIKCLSEELANSVGLVLDVPLQLCMVEPPRAKCDGRILDNELEAVRGMTLSRGYKSSHFVTGQRTQKCAMKNAFILIPDKKISNMNSLLPVLEEPMKMVHLKKMISQVGI